MIHKAWSSIEEMPYCFWGSSVKFQGHTALKIVEFDADWAFPDLFFKVIHQISRSHRLKNRWIGSNLRKITRPVAAIKSLRFALFRYNLQIYYIWSYLQVLKASCFIFHNKPQICITSGPYMNNFDATSKKFSLALSQWPAMGGYYITHSLIACRVFPWGVYPHSLIKQRKCQLTIIETILPARNYKIRKTMKPKANFAHYINMAPLIDSMQSFSLRCLYSHSLIKQRKCQHTIIETHYNWNCLASQNLQNSAKQSNPEPMLHIA